MSLTSLEFVSSPAKNQTTAAAVDPSMGDGGRAEKKHGPNGKKSPEIQRAS